MPTAAYAFGMALFILLAGCATQAPTGPSEPVGSDEASRELVTHQKNVTKRLEYAASPIIVAAPDRDAEFATTTASVRIRAVATWNATTPAAQTLLLAVDHDGASHRSISGSSPLELVVEAPELEPGLWSFGVGVPPGSAAVSQEVELVITHEFWQEK